MAEDAWRPRDPVAPGEPARRPEPDPDAGGPPRGSAVGVVLAAVVAALASAGLAWWVAAPQGPGPLERNAPPPAVASPAPAPPAPLRYAALDPDPAQVKRAWRDSRQAYVDGGPQALVDASVVCARTVPAEPQRLDYCVAYDVYAGEIVPPDAGAPADWFRDSAGRDLALARSALPGEADPANRIAQLTALTRAVIPRPAVARAARPKAQKAAIHRPARAAARPGHPARRHAVHGHAVRRHAVHRRPPRNFPAEIYPYTPLPDPPPEAAADPPH